MNETGLRPSSPPGPDGPVAPMPAPQAEPPPPPAMKSIDSLGFVMDVPVELTVELGRKHARIGEILRLGPGSILELSKANGEPLDVYVNNRLIARGEAVVVGEHYGIRLTEVLVVDDGRGRSGS
jgi:flagellar motor switch protein FliN/FliY